MPISYPYEVQLQVDREIQTRVVYAYKVEDALYQAVIEASSVNPGVEVKLVKIGPPQNTYAQDAVQQLVSAIQRSVKDTKDTKDRT